MISVRQNQNVGTNNFPLPRNYRNARRTNEIDVPYTIQLSSSFDDEPPSYDLVTSSFRT